MSLSIDTRCVSGVYALGQWFRVVPNTFCIDAYELMHIDEDCPFGNEHDNRDPEWKKREGNRFARQPHTDYYEMGWLYHQSQPEFKSIPLGDTGRVFSLRPQGSTGVAFKDADTGEMVCMSLMELKGFRCVSRAEAIKADPGLAPQA